MSYAFIAGLALASTLVTQAIAADGSIQGRALNSITGAPIRKALITLWVAQRSLTAETDTAGRFQFTALPAGNCRLTADHPEYLRRVPRPIVLGQDEHLTDADVRLSPQGLISGIVTDEDGDPVAGAAVDLLRQVYSGSTKHWERLNQGIVANETGQYRASNLKPGRYLVKARSNRPFVDSRYSATPSPDHPTRTYVPTFYPNVATEQEASPVEVAAGADVRGIDFQLLKIDVPLPVHVRGNIVGFHDPQARIAASIYSTEDKPFGGSASVGGPPEYAFDAMVPPGHYEVVANVSSGGPAAYGRTAITVSSDLNGVVVLMVPAAEITGRITLAEPGSRVKLQGVSVSLRHMAIQFFSADARADAAGKFAFPNDRPPGHYQVDIDVRSIPDGFFVQKTKLSGQEISPDDVEILASGELEIVLSNKAGTLTGSVLTKDGKPFPGSRATLISADPTSRPESQSADEGGRFKFRALRPGKYKLYAWEQVEDGLWQDPDFRSRFDAHALEITVGSSEVQNSDVHAIAAEEMN